MRVARLALLLAGALTASGFQAPPPAALGTVAVLTGQMTVENRTIDVSSTTPSWSSRATVLAAGPILRSQSRAKNTGSTNEIRINVLIVPSIASLAARPSGFSRSIWVRVSSRDSSD